MDAETDIGNGKNGHGHRNLASRRQITQCSFVPYSSSSTVCWSNTTELDLLLNISTVAPLSSTRMNRTVRLWYGPYILNNIYGNMFCKITPICPEKANSNITKTMKTVLCFSRDVVPSEKKPNHKDLYQIYNHKSYSQTWPQEPQWVVVNYSTTRVLPPHGHKNLKK